MPHVGAVAGRVRPSPGRSDESCDLARTRAPVTCTSRHGRSMAAAGDGGPARRPHPARYGDRRRGTTATADTRMTQIAGPHSIGGSPDTVRRTVLLTGASGVVGRALLRRLRDLDVVCLVHRSPVCGPNVTTVLGDVAKPMLGLAEQAYAELAARVDAVIHCAAITDFNRNAGSLEATNVAGTEQVARSSRSTRPGRSTSSPPMWWPTPSPASSRTG